MLGTTAYAYNGDGVLVQAGNTRYTQDLAAPLSQVLSDGTTSYVYGRDRLTSSAGNWYLGDALGSVRQTLDASGAVVATASYDPWGVPQGSSIAPFGFTGELQQGNAVYLRARWYDALHGTLMSVDPFTGLPEWPYSLHPYHYTYSNPINYTDSSGMSPQVPTDTEGTYIHAVIQMDFLAQFPPQFVGSGAFQLPIGGEIEKPFPRGGGFADTTDNNLNFYYEIKHNRHAGRTKGLRDL